LLFSQIRKPILDRIVGKRRAEKAAERAVERVVWKRMAEKVVAEAAVKIWDRQVQVSIS